MAKESKVGQKLSDLTTKKMIIIILAMLFSVPLFDVSSYINPPNNYEYGLFVLESLYNLTENHTRIAFNKTYWLYIKEESTSITPLV